MIIWGFCNTKLDFDEEAQASDVVENVILISDSEESNYKILDIINCRFSVTESIEGFSTTYFEHFQKLYSRHWYPIKKSKDFYYSRYYKFVSFFYHVLKCQKHSKVVFSNLPHEGPDYILYILAKELNIPTYIFFQTLIPSISFVSKTLSHKDRVFSFLKDESIEVKVEGLFNSLGKWFYIKNNSSESFILTQFKNIKRSVFIKLLCWPSILKDILSLKLEIQRVPAALDFSKRFIYFPLHLQPEMTTDALGGIFSDQFKAIERLEELLPEDTFIFIKENPKQSPHRREKFYDKLAKLKKVRLVSSNCNSLDIIKASIGVATITGTAGLEAVSLGKPALIFGDAWYLGLPNTYSIQETFEFFNEKVANFEEVKFRTIRLFENYGFPVLCDHAYSGQIKLFDPNKNAKEIVKIINKL